MFTPLATEFLAENAWRNSRDWFTAHKKDYQTLVQEPLYALADALAPTVTVIDGQLLTAPKQAVSRIYRDLRFAKGGALYREMLWISFRRDRQAFPCWPEFYFILSPETVFWGCGYYSAKADAMAQMRALVLEGHAKFKAADAVFAQHPEFSADGDSYTRSRFPDQPEALRRWLDKKTVCCTRYPGMDALFADDLAARIAEDYTAMRPVYDFTVYAEECARTETE